MKRRFVTVGVSLMCLMTLSVCMQASERELFTRNVEILTRTEQGKLPDCVVGDGYCFLDEDRIAEGMTIKER